MRDTSVEAEAYQDEIFRRMGPEGRFEAAWEMSLLAREFALSGIRRENPEFSESAVMQAYIQTLLD